MRNELKRQVSAYNNICFSERFLSKLSANVKQETLAKLIQRRLVDLDIKKAELARRSGLSKTYITDLSNETGNTQSGTYNLPPETVVNLAKALQVAEIEVIKAIGYVSEKPIQNKPQNVAEFIER